MQVFATGQELSATAANGFPQTVATFAALRAVAITPNAPPNGMVAQVLGATSAGDGGARYVQWSGSSSASDDGNTVFNPTGNLGAGRWLLYLPTVMRQPQIRTASATLGLIADIVFTGSAPATLTAPTLASSIYQEYRVKNRGTAPVTFAAAAGDGAVVYYGSAEASQVINPGESYVFHNDGDGFWNVHG